MNVAIILVSVIALHAPEVDVTDGSDLSCPCYYSSVGIFCRKNTYEFVVSSTGQLRPLPLDSGHVVRTMLSVFPAVQHTVRIVVPQRQDQLPREAYAALADLGVDMRSVTQEVQRDLKNIVVVVRFLGDVAEPLHEMPISTQPAAIGRVPNCTTKAGQFGFDPAAITIDLSGCTRESPACADGALASRSSEISALAKRGGIGLLAMHDGHADNESLGDDVVMKATNVLDRFRPAVLPSLTRKIEGVWLVIVPLTARPHSANDQARPAAPSR